MTPSVRKARGLTADIHSITEEGLKGSDRDNSPCLLYVEHSLSGSWGVW